jgi:drug/metabolite transporter (DMT)-like permease
VFPATSSPSWADLAGVVLAVVGSFLLVRVLLPNAIGWVVRRRGGDPATPPDELGMAVLAAMLVAAVIALSWSSDLGRPALGALLAASLGVILAMWRVGRGDGG